MVFHILNGGSAAHVFGRTGIGGEHISWREDLMTGSIPEGVSKDKEVWISLRAEQLSAAFDIDFEECRAELVLQERKLEESLAADEVVLWFEYDLFCQINLIYLLDWYAGRSERLPRPSLPPDVALLENGLGTLKPRDFECLFLQ